MAPGKVSVDIHDYGIALSGHHNRVQCKYCHKVIHHRMRLKHHLGGVPGFGAISCPKVPKKVKECFRSIVESEKATRPQKIRQYFSANGHRKRNFNIRDHCIALGGPQAYFQCKYCDKKISGFTRLKRHLGGISRGAASCPKVPQNVKKSVRSIVETEKATPPQKRKRCLNANGLKKRKSKIGQASDIERGNTADTDSVAEDVLKEPAVVLPKRVVSQTALKADQNEDSLSRQDKKCIHRFFYEAGIDNSEVKEMQEHVKIIRQAWKRMGCSILLDGWTDEKGRDLVSFIVDCPQGPVYLHSADVSSIVDNVDALWALLDGVIEDVGVQNVVQVVAFSSTGWVGALGKQFMDRYKYIFWTLDASHCLELILDSIAAMDKIKGTLEKAKVISEFLHSHPTLSKLLNDYTDSHHRIKPSKFSSAMHFLNLDNLVSEKQNLSAVFASSEWKTSIRGSEVEGKQVAKLVADSSFWKRAEMVVKATFPVVKVLYSINTDNKKQMGHIYETMDQMKETIKKELKEKESQYMPFWEAIDEIWNGSLHSPLHAAGCYLNPSIFYADNYRKDSEVSSGLLYCITRLVPDNRIQDLISKQLEAYKNSKGAFSKGSSVEQRNKFSPASWWLVYGEGYPELQQFAIIILSQTCAGASKYTLQRSLAEMVLTNGTEDQQALSDLVFLHYNTQLQKQHSHQVKLGM